MSQMKVTDAELKQCSYHPLRTPYSHPYPCPELSLVVAAFFLAVVLAVLPLLMSHIWWILCVAPGWQTDWQPRR